MWERERGGVEQNVVRSQFASIYGEQPRNERIKIKTSNYPPTSWMSATLNYLVLLYDYADCVHAFSQCLYPLCSLIQFACVGHCLDGDAPDYNLVMLVIHFFACCADWRYWRQWRMTATTTTRMLDLFGVIGIESLAYMRHAWATIRERVRFNISKMCFVFMVAGNSNAINI